MFTVRGSSLIFILGLVALVACTTQTFLPATTIKNDEYFLYTVQEGETVNQIATRYRITIEQLIALNSDMYPSLARDPSTLKPGWQLRLPKSAAQVTPDAPQVDLKEAAKQIALEINTVRAQKGYVLLRSDVALTHIANERSTDMIARDYFSHYDPQTGQEPLLRYLQATKFVYHFAGENIAEIKNDAGWVPPWFTVAARYSASDLASEFIKGWLNSPEHRANILNINYKRTGVALAVSTDGRRIVATQVFSD
jgi:uncharacterized protein YkwD